MKLAEALLLRADRQRRLAELRSRAQSAARHQEGEEPAEDAQALTAEALEILQELERLIRQINRTNGVATLPDGRSLTAALAERDVLRLRHGLLTSVADAGAGRTGNSQGYIRQMRSELKFISAVAVGSLRREADETSRRYRELDAQIQQVNWSADLIEDEG